MARAATNSTTSRWGHTWTLSSGVAFTSWIEPDLTTVSRRWVWPPGPVAAGGGAAVATAAAATGRRRPRHRRRPRRRRRPCVALAALERSSRWAGILLSAALASAGAARRPPAAARAASPASPPRPWRPRPSCGPLRPACGGVRGSRSWPSRLRSIYSGPEMPPSLRTRQKWIAMKMTMTNGRNNTCSTYQRNNVSVPISLPPSSTKRTWSPNTGV